MEDRRLIRIVQFIAAANLAYFFVEFWSAQYIGSVSLFADSIDFLEDAALNGLILLASLVMPHWRLRIGYVLAGMLLLPAFVTIWTMWHKITALTPPEPMMMSLVGMGAMVINLICALLLVRYRHAGGSLIKAAFLSARNDVIANVAIVIAAFVTAATTSAWPDIVVGCGIFWMNLDAAREVWESATAESDLAATTP
jgi:Co/Zn/Cd efflux system component